MEQWYALYTKPNAESRVAAWLQQQGIVTYLPQLVSHCGHRSPLFPCYLFGRIDFDAGNGWQICWTPGLRRVIAFGGHPTPLPNALIELIQEEVDASNPGSRAAQHTLHPGDTVQITAGPFQGMRAILEQHAPPAKRVQVLLTILGRVSRVQVAATAIQKTTATNNPPAAKISRGTRGRGRSINR